MSKFIIESNKQTSFLDLGNYLISKLKPMLQRNNDIVFLCIGSDRCTGDSLGPLVGDKIQFLSSHNVFIYGNLESTVNATNLNNVLTTIKLNHRNPFIIAIDASLGNSADIGKIIINDEPLYPGKALNKDLPSIGNISIVGIVNISSCFQFTTLQNTRLYIVMKIANTIAKGISYFSLKQNTDDDCLSI